MDSDLAIRNAAIEHCEKLTAAWGDAVPAAELTKGFAFKGQQIKLVSWARGIFNPGQLGDAPLPARNVRDRACFECDAHSRADARRVPSGVSQHGQTSVRGTCPPPSAARK